MTAPPPPSTASVLAALEGQGYVFVLTTAGQLSVKHAAGVSPQVDAYCRKHSLDIKATLAARPKKKTIEDHVMRLFPGAKVVAKFTFDELRESIFDLFRESYKGLPDGERLRRAFCVLADLALDFERDGLLVYAGWCQRLIDEIYPE